MLKISHLTIKYDKEILNDVEFLAYRGFVHLIRGESGSGKTTLLYRLGLISDQKDYEYTIDDINAIKNDNMRRSNIAFLLQNAMLVEEYSVAENIIFSAQLVDKSITDADILNILDEVDLIVPLNQDIQTLSGGERQRLAIACALIKDTDIIILDEPTSSLDKGHEKEIFELLKEIAHHKNKCVIISSHSQEAIQYSDIICEIKDKRLVLIKNSFNHSLFSIKESDFKVSNIFDYIAKHLLILKKKTISIMLLLLLSFSFLMAINTALDIMQKNSIDDITKLSENQLFITTQNDNIYADNEQLEDTFNDAIINKKYGYIQSYFMLDDIKVDVIPSFEENDFSNKYESKYNILDQKGVIYSQSLYKYLKRNNITVTKFDNDMIINNKIYHYQCNVKGILKEGVLNNYTNNEYYVYLPYNILQSLSNSHHYTGYTLFTKDIDSYNQLINILKEKQVDINDTFINTTGINDVINNTKQLKTIFTIITSIIILIISSYILLHHFNLRKKEFVVDIVSGFSLKNIYSIIRFEILFYMICTFIILSIISFIIHYNIIQLIIIISIITILSYIVCLVDMRKLSVENILRD